MASVLFYIMDLSNCDPDVNLLLRRASPDILDDLEQDRSSWDLMLFSSQSCTVVASLAGAACLDESP